MNGDKFLTPHGDILTVTDAEQSPDRSGQWLEGVVCVAIQRVVSGHQQGVTQTMHAADREGVEPCGEQNVAVAVIAVETLAVEYPHSVVGVDVYGAVEGCAAGVGAELFDGGMGVSVKAEESVGAGGNPYHSVAVDVDAGYVGQRVGRVIEVFENGVGIDSVCSGE